MLVPDCNRFDLQRNLLEKVMTKGRSGHLLFVPSLCTIQTKKNNKQKRWKKITHVSREKQCLVSNEKGGFASTFFACSLFFGLAYPLDDILLSLKQKYFRWFFFLLYFFFLSRAVGCFFLSRQTCLKLIGLRVSLFLLGHHDVLSRTHTLGLSADAPSPSC